MLKNRLLYSLLFISSLVFVYFYGGKVPYMLFYVTLMLPLFSFLYTLLVFLNLEFKQSIDRTSLIKGEKIHFKCILYNRNFFLCPYIRIKFCNGNRILAREFYEKNLSLMPSSSRYFIYELECKYRGRYAIGIDRLEIEDFLGIFKFKRKVHKHYDVVVYPRIVILEKFNIKTSFVSESHTLLNTNYQDNSIVSDIRKYVVGDSFRRIHWKISAKTSELMVKNMQSTSETNMVLILDLRKTGLDVENSVILEDRLVETAVAIIHYCLTNWIRVRMVYYRDGICTLDASNISDFKVLYNFLSEVAFDQDTHVSEIIKLFSIGNISKTNILTLTPHIDTALYEELCKLRLFGHETMLVNISYEDITGKANADSERILKSLEESGIKTYSMNCSDDIKHLLELHS